MPRIKKAAQLRGNGRLVQETLEEHHKTLEDISHELLQLDKKIDHKFDILVSKVDTLQHLMQSVLRHAYRGPEETYPEVK